MFTIPAAILGTKHDVTVHDVGVNFASALFGSPGHCQTLPHVTMIPINSMGGLFSWTWKIPFADLDRLVEIYLPNVQYSALEASWNAYGKPTTVAPTPTTASAFKVGDLVVWNPQPNRKVSSILIVGATYRILACTWAGPPAVWSLGYYNSNTHIDVADENELTLCSQQLTLPLEPYTVSSYTLPAKKCECGAMKCKSNIHSTWCQLYTP